MLQMREHVTPEINHSGRRLAFGAMASGAVNAIKLILQLLLFPVMARLLGPDEFGLYALALPTVALIALLADGGLGATLAREDESSEVVWSSAFWALLFLGITLALCSAGFGLLLGYLAKQPRLYGIIGLLSVSLVFMTLSVVPAARLARRKHLGLGAAADLTANVIGAAIAVVMAWRGAGAWSLAVQYLVIYAVRAVLLNCSAFHLPKAVFSFRALQHHLVSGGAMIAIRISDYAGRLIENFLINRMFGTTLLGSYTFGNQVSKVATEAASNVIWAALYVQALTGERSQIVILHRRLCRMLGLALFPATFLAAAAAPEIVNLLLGPKWIGLTFFLQVFLPTYAFSAISCQTAPILMAYGRINIFFWCIFGLSLGRVLAVGLGWWLGLDGAVCGIAVVTLMFCGSMLLFSAEATGCHPLPMLRGLVGPAISAAVASGCYLTIVHVFGANITWMGAGLAGGLLAYSLSMVLIDRRRLGEDWTIARRIISPRASHDPGAPFEAANQPSTL
jgi:O-antigen/teichoic acid export membrane protein